MAITENILRSHNHLDQYRQYRSYGQMIDEHLNRLYGDDVCLIDASTDERLTVAELKTRANSIAVALIERGINKTDKIAFCGQNSIQHSILRFAAYFMGTPFTPLNPLYAKHEVERAVRYIGANIIIAGVEDKHKFNELFDNNNNENKHNVKLVVIFDGKHDKYVTYEQLLEEGRDQTLERIPYFDVSAEEIVCYSFTSGTTADPKCVTISHRAFINSCFSTALDVDRDDINNNQSVVGMVYAIGHVLGTHHLSMEIIEGSTLVLYPKFSAQLVLRSIEKYRINVLKATPVYHQVLFDRHEDDSYDLSSLRTIQSAGNFFPTPLAHAVVHKYGLQFIEMYGTTEFHYITKGADSEDGFIVGNVGQLSNGTELKIVDLTTGEGVGAGIEGEICIRGDSLFSGYLNNSTATNEAFYENGWYRTGDIGHYDHKRRLFLTDRLKEIITVGDHTFRTRISPAELEQYLLTHKAIAEVAVFGVNNTTGAQWPRAYVVVKNGHNITGDIIEKYVSDTLSVAKHLKAGVVFVASIQRTSIGKVDRKYYKNLVEDEVVQ